MKTIRFILVATAAIFIFSNADCKKKVKIEKIVNGAIFRITALPQDSGTFDIMNSVKFDMDALLKPYDLSLDKVTSIKPETVTITIEDTSATKITFDIVNKINLEIATSTLPMRKVASKDPVPHFLLVTIAPEVEKTTEFLDFAKANDVTYHLTGFLNKRLDHPVNLKIEIQWHVIGTL